MELSEEEYLAHYGTPRHSGRYPWGSGEDDETAPRNSSFLDSVEEMRRQGLTEKEIAEGVGLKSTTQLRAQKSIEKNALKQAQIGFAQRLKEKGWSNVAIGERMGLPESSVRALLAPGAKDKNDVLTNTVNALKADIDEKKYLDVGVGNEYNLNAGVSTTMFKNARAVLQEQGYPLYYLKVDQAGTGHQTTLQVMAPPGTTYSEVYKNRDNIQVVGRWSEDGGRTSYKIDKPLAINPDRVGVVYKEDGGADADGVMYVRPGVKDVSLGGAKYAQVRVQVGDDHYLKGMAVYKDDLPDGVDILFNTNKSNTGNKLDAMKKLDKENPDNPFGAQLKRQIKEKIGDKEVVTSSMNLVNEEGDWGDWSKTIATQVLSKQSPILAKSQLNMTYERRLNEYNAIRDLTNPTVRKRMLESFADETDSAAVHLKAAGLPRQGWHVILPMKSLKENEVYAPNFIDGENVVLIRYPHGGTFEIPELVVNNNHRPARKTLGQAKDAIAIHPKVAERLSGADFDGDTVLVIPNNQRRIKSTPALEGLKGFDPKAAYPKYEGMRVMTAQQKAFEMGNISNLITDMTIRQAPHSEIARAVRHSMVVIDAEKHELNWKQSAIDNGIADLKTKYQKGPRSGASTLISRAQRTVRVEERKDRRAAKGGPIDLETGRRVFEPTNRTSFKTGKKVQQKSKELAETDDAHTLSSGTNIERIYADHSNRLKALANQARLDYVRTPRLKYSPSAKKVYAAEVESLDAKLALAKRNAPLERRAQIIANANIRARRQANPNMDEPTLKKIKGQELERARARTGASKQSIKITDREWEAIQHGAISDHKLGQILDNADIEIVKQHATPKAQLKMTATMKRRAEQMFAAGATRAEVAAQLGVSLSTLDRSLAEA